MLTAGDVLAKTLAKSQKVTFWSQKMALDIFLFGSLLEMLLILHLMNSPHTNAIY